MTSNKQLQDLLDQVARGEVQPATARDDTSDEVARLVRSAQVRPVGPVAVSRPDDNPAGVAQGCDERSAEAAGSTGDKGDAAPAAHWITTTPFGE